MSLVSSKKPWSKKSKSPIIIPKDDKHTHTWIKIMSGQNYCLECSCVKQYDIEEAFDITDLSSYFEVDITRNCVQELVSRITTVNSIFKFLKERNPEATLDELLKTMESHFKQMNNESKYYCLERKMVKKETY